MLVLGKLLPMALALTIGMCPVAPDAKSVPATDWHGATLILKLDSMRILEARTTDGIDRLTLRELVGDRELVLERTGLRVAESPNPVISLGDQKMAFLDRGKSGWVLVGHFEKGGGTGMDYWWGSQDIGVTGHAGSVDRFQVGDVALMESDAPYVLHERVPGGSVLNDLRGFQLIESPFGIHVLGCGENIGRSVDDHDRNNGGVVWIAAMPRDAASRPASRPAPRVRMALVAKRVVEGAEPRVVRSGGSNILFVRRCRQNFREDAPIGVYRSSDLLNWNLVTKLSEGVSVGMNYSVIIDNDCIWMASTVVAESHYRVRLLRFDSNEAKWTQEALIETGVKEVPTERVPVLWMRPTGKPTGPSIVLRTVKGEMTQVRK